MTDCLKEFDTKIIEIQNALKGLVATCAKYREELSVLMCKSHAPGLIRENTALVNSELGYLSRLANLSMPDHLIKALRDGDWDTSASGMPPLPEPNCVVTHEGVPISEIEDHADVFITIEEKMRFPLGSLPSWIKVKPDPQLTKPKSKFKVGELVFKVHPATLFGFLEAIPLSRLLEWIRDCRYVIGGVECESLLRLCMPHEEFFFNILAKLNPERFKLARAAFFEIYDEWRADQNDNQ